jgi:hypothetical protein
MNATSLCAKSSSKASICSDLVCEIGNCEATRSLRTLQLQSSLLPAI